MTRPFRQYPVMFAGAKPVPENLQKVHEALGWLDGFIGKNTFAAGENLTVADFVLVSGVVRTVLSKQPLLTN